MANDEELQKRRQRRDQLRQQRLAQQKQLITKLMIAAVALVVCTGIIVGVALQSGSQPPTEPIPTTDPIPTDAPATDPSGTTADPTGTTADPTGTTAEPTESTDAASTPEQTEEQTEPEETQPSDTTVIHFTAAGDITVTDKTAVQDYEEVFQDVLPVLCSGDLTVVNFEGNLVGAPYGAEKASAPQTLMEALRNAGVDLIQMANSRSIYNGLSGLNTTLNNIRAAGLEPVGAWATNEEAKKSGGYTIREVNGIRVAIVAFTKGMDSMALPTGSENCVNILYQDYATVWQKVDTAGITAILNNVAKENPDITIALVHWGSEYRDQISSTQKTIKNLMLENGVDAIIGTHPHYVQAMELDQENGTFVAYSLGDLLGDGETAGTEYGVILDLEITKDHLSGETRVTGYSYTPIFNARSEDQSIRILRLNEAIKAYEVGYMYRVSKDLYEDMLYAQTRVVDRVTSGG